MLKKNGGITLIALVVTIIVLLILAGITIAMLTGNNGIITRTNDSKMSQIEGQVQEEIKLAMQSAKIYATQKAVETPGGGWLAANHIEDSAANANDGIIYVMTRDLQSPEYSVSKVANATQIYIKYESSAYDMATNYTDAKIEAVITITGNKFEITSLTRTRKSGDTYYIIGSAS